MSALGRSFLRGIYATPGAVAAAPDYARKLVEDVGINLFVLRTGFNPDEVLAPALDRTAGIVGELEAEVWLLVGAWWGYELEAGADTMQGTSPWAVSGTERAHESQWPMRTPGGPGDEAVKGGLRILLSRYDPEGICLTHARFRHPADIPGLFEFGEGDFEKAMQTAGLDRRRLEVATRNVDRALQAISPLSLLDLARERRLPEFLDGLVETTTFSSWFETRARIVERSLSRFKHTVQAASQKHVAFGANAYAPAGAHLCGQDYASLGNVTDFVQPLLGYMRWHVLQPLRAWTDFLCERVAKLDETTAMEVAANLFGLEDLSIPLLLESAQGSDEGPPDLILRVVEHQLRAASLATVPLLPVLRGKEWPKEIVDELTGLVATRGFAGVIYQGTDALAGSPPGQGWQ